MVSWGEVMLSFFVFTVFWKNTFLNNLDLRGKKAEVAEKMRDLSVFLNIRRSLSDFIMTSRHT